MFFLLAQTPAGGTGGLFDSKTIIFFAVIIGIFYLLIMRPQQKKEAERRKMLESLKKGQRVITIGQMVGKIVSIKGNEIVLRVDDKGDTKICMLRSGIARILGDDEDLGGEEDDSDGKELETT